MAERASQLTVNSSQFTENEVSPRKVHILPPSYDVEFDRRNPNPALIRKNLETDLGERFNVEISQVEYIFEGPFLKSTQTNEFFIETIKRGIQNRRNYAGTHDRIRELAEFENFNKVQNYLWADDNPDTKVITISPRGPKDSCYQHNFFDLYERTEDGKILMTRYASQMTLDQFKNGAKQIDLNFDSELGIDDLYFLQNPIKTKLTKEEILELFHRDQKALKVEEHRALLFACGPLIDDYIKDPSNNHHRALLNFADDYIFNPEARGELLIRTQNPESMPLYLTQLATRPVRYVVTGCGAQGDIVSMTNNLFYSVADFASFTQRESADTNDFPCPQCGHMIIYGSGTKECPSCGLAATCG